MKVRDAVVLITGANRGIGLAFAQEALARGARKVYAAARNPSQITLAGVIPVKLDVTSAEDVTAAARACQDVTLVVNNAGIARLGGLQSPETHDSARTHFETNVIGVLRMTSMNFCMRDVAVPPSELQLGERTQLVLIPDHAAAQSVPNHGSGGRTG